MEEHSNDQSVPVRKRVEFKTHILSFLDCGPKDGKTVILLHGFPTSNELWRPLQAHLANRGYRTLAPDLPGFGKTVCSKELASSWSDCLNLLKTWLDSEKQINDIWWFGHHLGALMALECAKLFANKTERCTFITPILSSSELWPESALKAFKFSMSLGLYGKMAEKQWLEKMVLANRKTDKKAVISHFDRYLHQRLLFNDKYTDPTRLKEFAHFVKSIPKNTPEKFQTGLKALKIPKQIIFDALPEESESKQLLRWLASLAGQKNKFPPYPSVLSNLVQDAQLELITVKAGNPYLPLAQSLGVAEAGMIWAKEDMTRLLIEEYKEEHKKPEPLPDVPQPEIRINPALSLPPDGKPEHVQRQQKAPAKRPVRKKQ